VGGGTLQRKKLECPKKNSLHKGSNHQERRIWKKRRFEQGTEGNAIKEKRNSGIAHIKGRKTIRVEGGER